MRTIRFIDSEQYFTYLTWYDRGMNHASVQFLLLIWWFSVRASGLFSLSTQVVFVLNSESFRNRSVIIRLFSSEIHIRHPYEVFFFFGGSSKSIANLICSYRVSCGCEPSVFSIPNGISRTVRDTIVVWITRPSSFFFWFVVVCASVRTIRVYVSSFRTQF